MSTMPNWGTNIGTEGSGYFNPREDGLNQLLVVWVLRHIPNAGPTSYQPNGTDAIELDIVKIDTTNPAASPVYRSQWLRSGRVIGKLKGFAGSPNPCLITFFEETPGRESTRNIRFIASEPGVQELASAWYESLGEDGFVPSPPSTDEQVAQRINQRAQQAQQAQQQYGGWPAGSVPAGQYYAQQGGGYGGAPQQQQQAPQWGAPQQQWGAPQQQAAPQPQWGAPQQQQQQQAPQQQAAGWSAQQPAANPQQAQWGPAPAQPQQSQLPPGVDPGSVLGMIAGAKQQIQENPPF